MTREDLTRAILDAQVTKPAGIITGTSNWAAWIADQVIQASNTPMDVCAEQTELPVHVPMCPIEKT